MIDRWLYFCKRDGNEKRVMVHQIFTFYLIIYIFLFTKCFYFVSPDGHLNLHMFSVGLCSLVTVCSYSPVHLSVAVCHSPELPHTETLLPLQL